jgi:TetR/AcrR family tetracycline transcriptional repressor
MLNEMLDSRREHINRHIDQHMARLNSKLNLKQDQIIEAALELLSEKGLNDLSLRDIAKKLGIQAPAIYWYFNSKSVLVDYMAEAILQKEFNNLKLRNSDETWQEYLVNNMLRLRKAMLAYPDGGRVVAGAHFFPTVTLPKLFEILLESLIGAGLDSETARCVVVTCVHYTFGVAIEGQSSPSTDQIIDFDEREFFNSYPNLSRVVKETGQTKKARYEDYKIGLQYIIRGAEKRS